MRIKCPNSDVYLELPGDRTDMKFTCPACRKIHRVTVSITTPGEESAPGAAGSSRSITRAHPQIPKKYATGAYAPVVDIPIDANFILLDGETSRTAPGVDLGQAAAPAASASAASAAAAASPFASASGSAASASGAPFTAAASSTGSAESVESFLNRELAERKTEIIGDRRRPEEKKTKDTEQAEEEKKAQEKDTEKGKGKDAPPPAGESEAGVAASDENSSIPPGRADSEETARDIPADADAVPEGTDRSGLTGKTGTPEQAAAPKQAASSEPPKAPTSAGDGAFPKSGRRLWDEIEGTAAASSPGAAKTSAAGASHSVRRTARPAKGRASLRVPAFILLALLAGAGGFFGWQHYLREGDRARLETDLVRAAGAWERGDAALAAGAARDAEAALRQAEARYTLGAVWNRLAAQTGLTWTFPSSFSGAKEKLGEYVTREKALAAFRATLDPDNPFGMAQTLAEAVERDAAGDSSLAGAMRRTVASVAVATVRERAAALSPEEATAKAATGRKALEPVLSAWIRDDFLDNLTGFIGEQRQRLRDESQAAAAAIATLAAAGETDALDRYLALDARLRWLDASLAPGAPLPELAGEESRPALRQLSRLAGLASRALSSARSALSRQEGDEGDIDDLQSRAAADTQPHPAMAAAAAAYIDGLRAQSDELLRLRAEVYNRLQKDVSRNRASSGPRLAWSLLRIGFEDPEVEIDPAGFRYDSSRAEMNFSFRGLPVGMTLGEGDFENRVRAVVDGRHFSAGWSPLFHKPLTWMADLAVAMNAAGVERDASAAWEVIEGPGGPLALSLPVAAASEKAVGELPPDPTGRRIFFAGRLRPATELPASEGALATLRDFRAAAERLHDGVMGDASIPQPLRQALKPILMGTYQAPDSRDYFDSAFCRRLIEANYLETFVKPLPDERRRELDAYRSALERLEAGNDEFAAFLDDGSRLVAVTGLDAPRPGEDRSGDQDPDTGESLPRYSWRVEKDGATVFYSPMPSRFAYSFMLAEHYDGKHRVRPSGRPRLTEVWHTSKGRIASYAQGADKAEGDADLWNQAIALDSSGRFDPTVGPPGWNFPLHVLVRDDQGDPQAIATPNGVVNSPNFSGIADLDKRRAAQDEWLDVTARVLATPGELGLIFHQFFRYCSDSPLPEMPNLIGSHYGLSDTHQTVYQSLDRRWVGRLIGDCDDLAEFFQVLTRKQGKLSYVMQLPGHAAAGYVDRLGDREFRFVVLQTGPVLQFTGPTLDQTVEIAYRSFDRGDGISHMTTDAVPLLLRFADEETRTPFVLSDRIFVDAEYADTMIRVQGYWHENVYSAALEVMEKMVAEDKEIGNIKELGSLYERVGMYDKSADMRRRELDMVRGNPQAALSTLLELAQLHFQDKDREKALEALGEMEKRMRDMIRRDDAQEFFRAMTFRSYWAMYLSRLGQPARAWELIKYDVSMTKRQLGRPADPTLRTMTIIYDRMCLRRDAAGGKVPREDEAAMREVRRELDEAFGRGYFKGDDAYNAVLGRYFVLGRYVVADVGRSAGLAKLLQDGPYPTAPRDQGKRGRGVDEEDWNWLRITPTLYLALGLEMLDRDEYPELYDPAGAKPLLENVTRAVRKGTGLGSDVGGEEDVVKSDMTLSFLNRDVEAFRRSLAVVKEKNYASLYDDAAMTFGLHCGLIPLADFPAWIEAFREAFPGRQHYFKVVYRALDKENYDHALAMAEATARFFPEHELLRKEAEFVRKIVPGLKQRKQNAGL